MSTTKLPTPESPEAVSPVPARYGHLGQCHACGQPALTHFDTAARFIGCPAVADGTVFELVPVNGSSLAIPIAATTHAVTRVREFTRAHYIATLPAGKTLADLDLSEQRHRVMEALISFGNLGGISADIAERAGIPANAVTGHLKWLRDKTYVVAYEDITPNSQK